VYVECRRGEVKNGLDEVWVGSGVDFGLCGVGTVGEALCCIRCGVVREGRGSM